MPTPSVFGMAAGCPSTTNGSTPLREATNTEDIRGERCPRPTAVGRCGRAAVPHDYSRSGRPPEASGAGGKWTWRGMSPNGFTIPVRAGMVHDRTSTRIASAATDLMLIPPSGIWRAPTGVNPRLAPDTLYWPHDIGGTEPWDSDVRAYRDRRASTSASVRPADPSEDVISSAAAAVARSGRPASMVGRTPKSRPACARATS